MVTRKLPSCNYATPPNCHPCHVFFPIPHFPRARHMSWKEMTSYFTRNCTCLVAIDVREVMEMFSLENMKIGEWFGFWFLENMEMGQVFCFGFHQTENQVGNCCFHPLKKKTEKYRGFILSMQVLMVINYCFDAAVVGRLRVCSKQWWGFGFWLECPPIYLFFWIYSTGLWSQLTYWLLTPGPYKSCVSCGNNYFDHYVEV